MPNKEVGEVSINIRKMVQRDGPARIATYRDYKHTFHITDYVLRRLLRKDHGDIKFHHIKYRVGTLVKSRSNTINGIWLVVGHGYCGKFGEKRGCYGCKIGQRGLHKRWHFLGAEKNIIIYTPSRNI